MAEPIHPDDPSHPSHPEYLAEASVRDELTRTFDICRTCRRCEDRCPSFPTLFDLVDRDGVVDAGSLTPAEQDTVVDGCFQCKQCVIGCPYGPGVHEAAIDVPRVMMRAVAMQRSRGAMTMRRRRADQVIGRADLAGRIGSRFAPVVNRWVEAPAGSIRRRTVAAVTGVSPVRRLPSYARQRFSRWFAARTPTELGQPVRGRVSIYPTCSIEYQAPQIGRDLVAVYERNGIECALSGARCCGAPWLHSGDLARFRRAASQNVAVLANEIRRGAEVVVVQPTCGLVITQDYPEHVGGGDAELVAAHTVDAMAYLGRLHRDHGGLDDGFHGDVPDVITHHAACHVRAQGADDVAPELLALTGASISVVTRCSGIDGGWGLRSGNETVSMPMAERLGAEITAHGVTARGGTACGDAVITGECHLANTAIEETTALEPVHPVQVLARAYGPDRRGDHPASLDRDGPAR